MDGRPKREKEMNTHNTQLWWKHMKHGITKDYLKMLCDYLKTACDLTGASEYCIRYEIFCKDLNKGD